jgi:hypothetical protein
MALQRMDVKPFTTEEIGASNHARHSHTRFNRSRVSHKRRRLPQVSRSLMVKIGICAAACAVILGMKALNTPTTEQVVSGVRTAINEETDIDKMLGKLQFVELPNALEVFSNDSKMVVPVNATKAYVESEAQYAIWEGAPNAQVIASAAGEVRAIGEDSILGKYVRLSHAGDLETIYYGLATIQVEEGQPIRRQDTLGTLGEDGTLRLSVLLAGEPQSPDTYWDLVHEG